MGVAGETVGPVGGGGGSGGGTGTVSLITSTDGSITVTNPTGPTVNLAAVGGGGGVTSFNTRTGAVVPASGDYTVSQVTGAAPLASPTFTGTAVAPLAAPGDNSGRIATTSFVTAAIAALVTGVSSFNSRVGAVAPTTGDYTVSQVTGAAPLASPTFTGVPAGPTATAGTNTTQLASTAFVTAAVLVETNRATTAENLLAPKASPTLTGVPLSTTAAPGTNTTQIATTAFVTAATAALVTGVSSFNTRTGAVTAASGDYTVSQVTGAAPLASPTFTGTPAAPTAAPGTNTTQIASTAFVTAAVTAVSPLTGDVTTSGAAATLVGTSNVESIIRANTLNQMGAPTASVNWNNQSITQLLSLSMTDGTAGHGSISATLNPPLITALASSSDTAAVWSLGMISSNPTLAFGVGGTTATDVSVSRTGTGLLQLTAATTTVSAILSVGPQSTTLTTNPTATVTSLAGTYTLNVASFPNAGTAFTVNPTITFQVGGSAFGSLSGLFVGPSMKNLSTASVGVGLVTGYIFSPTFTIDTATGIGNFAQSAGINVAPTFSVANSGTGTSASSINFQSGGMVNTGHTVTAWTDFKIIAITGSGTITTQIGLDIPALTRATTSIGIRNAAQTAFTPSTAQVVAAAFTITANATQVQLTSAGPVTATTVAPIIAVPNAAANGQVLIIVNANTTLANILTFTSGTTEKVSLGAATRAVGAGGSLTLVYNSTFGRWVEVGFNVGGN